MENSQIQKSTPKIIAIVPAAGTGFRMNSTIPKQYLTIGETTVLEHTLNKLLTHPEIDHVIVAINPNDTFFYSLEISKHPKISTVFGGDTRAYSVLAGLQSISDDNLALVHDAARPCVQHDDISKLINCVQSNKQGAILAMRVSDTIKRAYTHQDRVIHHSEDRCYLWAAATPQLFKAGELKQCLQKALTNNITITDEASAIEYCGGHPLLVECRRDNLKITRPEDLPLAKFYLTNQI